MDNSPAVKEELLMKIQYNEDEILRQVAALLAREKLLNPEEHLRFLALLAEEK